jgi:hypothetical protein
MKFNKIFIIFVIFFASVALGAPKKSDVKIKFYNFDDLLINGQYRKPQVLYIDSREKLRFERLLKLKKDFLPKLKNTQKDPSLR